ncbi:hypothetical protein D3C80_1521140 [compost metagenome]
MLAGLQRLAERHAAIGEHFGVFLHLHGVRAFGQRRTSEDSRASARLQRRRRLSGEDLLAHHQRLALPVAMAQRVAIHGAVRPRRQVERGDQRLGQHAAISLVQADAFALCDRGLFRQSQQARQRLLDRQQPGLVATAHPRLSHSGACFRCGTKLHGR